MEYQQITMQLVRNTQIAILEGFKAKKLGCPGKVKEIDLGTPWQKYVLDFLFHKSPWPLHSGGHGLRAGMINGSAVGAIYPYVSTTTIVFTHNLFY